MTYEKVSLRAYVDNTRDADLLLQIFGLAADRLIKLEAGKATVAGYGDKNPVRQTHRIA